MQHCETTLHARGDACMIGDQMACLAGQPVDRSQLQRLGQKQNYLPPVNWRWVEEGDGYVGRLQPPGQPLRVGLPSGLQCLVPYPYRGWARLMSWRCVLACSTASSSNWCLSVGNVNSLACSWSVRPSHHQPVSSPSLVVTSLGTMPRPCHTVASSTVSNISVSPCSPCLSHVCRCLSVCWRPRIMVLQGFPDCLSECHWRQGWRARLAPGLDPWP